MSADPQIHRSDLHRSDHRRRRSSTRRLPRLSLSAAALCVAGLAMVAAGQGAGAASSPSAADDDRIGRADQPGKAQVVHVRAGTAELRSQVADLGLDVTESADSTGIDVVLYGDDDADVLRRAGFSWKVRIPDLEARMAANRKADRRYARQVDQSPLPSGRTSYRTLADYEKEMRQLAKRYPGMVKPLVLPNRTVLGKRVHGIEITTGAANVQDGKPIFLMVGAHHAREWPSSEHAMEFAYDLLKNYKTSPRARKLVQGIRTVIVPVVNVDGFEVSRDAAPLGDFSRFDYEMKRKNCRITADTPPAEQVGPCANNPTGRLRGVDLNRNYPGFWGGAGASPTWTSDTFRGDGPGSEPETDNLRRFVSARQVTNLITNHTFSNLVLRPPSIAATGFSPDEKAYRALGDAMTNSNGYANWASFQLYDTSGSLEDWSYWNTGGFGFTFEIGPDEFHPPFVDGVVAEYMGLPPAQGAGFGGNREAYYRMAESTLDRSMHSVIRGNAPKNRTLQIRKRFITATSPVIDRQGNPGVPRYYEDTLTSSYRSQGGRFTWDVNPSTRPLVVGRYGRDPQGPPSPEQAITNPEGTPADGEYEETTFTVPGAPDDNGVATVEVGWPSEADWDVDVFDSRGRPVAQAATLDNPEQAMLIDPPPGTYTLRVTNYEGGDAAEDWTAKVTFASPTPGTYSGLHEAWTLTCKNTRTGKVVGTREVVVDRGDSVGIGNACTAAAKVPSGTGGDR